MFARMVDWLTVDPKETKESQMSKKLSTAAVIAGAVAVAITGTQINTAEAAGMPLLMVASLFWAAHSDHAVLNCTV